MEQKTEVEQEPKELVGEKPQVKFDPTLDKFTNIKTPEQLLSAVEVFNSALGTRLKYWVKDGKGNNQLVETSVWTDEETKFIKHKLLTLLNHVQ